MEGEGHYKWPDGREYIGEFAKGKKNGIGKYIWKDGRSYIGYWANGKQHGLGLYTDESNNKHFGIWVNGKRTRWFTEEDIDEIKEDDCYKRIINYIK